MNATCSCIIPFYNEGKRLISVLDEVVRVKNLSQIILVDDGSTDNAAELVMKKFPALQLIKLDRNYGKTHAVNIGVEHVKSEYILLLDGDLKNLKAKEIENAVNKIFNNDADMIILRRINAAFVIKMNRGDTLLTGERILKKEDLRKILNDTNKPPKGYQLEFAINQYMIDRNKKVYWMPSSALNTYQTSKKSLIKGLQTIISAHVSFLGYIGFKNFIKQELFFAKEKAK